ncbi:FAD-binding oxidoreductase [Streptomyces griseus]|uniref:FAD-binding oxidoreductase n=1 Tax=Streptomyces griseus TaxID=1911 RepID=UPI001F45EF0B|nr:FAD-binding protein [Streptomyces griseus]
MSNTSRRAFLGAGTVVGGATVALATGGLAEALAAPTTKNAACGPVADAVTVGPGDPRYVELTTRGDNGRFIGSPDSVHVVHSTEQIARVVQQAVAENKRVAIRSGGHCFEGLVDDPAVKVLIDVSEMKGISYDRGRRAFCVEVGATLGQIYRTLYFDWGVTLPGGLCPPIGAGGHIVGGGYGPLGRKYGLTIDYLYAVEVVVVTRSGKVRSVIATREADDPNRDLWWAHTGGGGGNFGVATRYWFRAPDATGSDPTQLLPKPPGSLLKTHIEWPWRELDQESFSRLVRNHARFYERNSNVGNAYESMWSQLFLNHNSVLDGLFVESQIDNGLPNARQLIDRYISELNEGVGFAPSVTHSTGPWLKVTLSPTYDHGIYTRSKSKGAMIRKPWTDRQIGVMYKHLNNEGYYYGQYYVASYGGKINDADPGDTAYHARGSIMRTWMSTYWADKADDEAQFKWVRDFYQELFADTGGMPLPGDRYEGTSINYADVDVRDPKWNTTGKPWMYIYYGENYKRLQQVKKRWDPTNFFRHQLSIPLPD